MTTFFLAGFAHLTMAESGRQGIPNIIQGKNTGHVHTKAPGYISRCFTSPEVLQVTKTDRVNQNTLFRA